MHYKTRKPAVLSGGLKWKPINASASDMDTMAHRESIVRDIARAYRIPLHLINGTGGDSQTYQNVESAGINFVRHTLLPYMRRIEGAISELLPPDLSVRFNADEYLRADLATRVRASQIQISSGMLTPNEARHIEGREPYDGGDNFTFLPTGVVPPLGSDKERPA
jgi:HK97 family phage portal protein